MRNDRPSSRREKGGATARAHVLPLSRKSRTTLSRRALIVLEYGENTYRRLTPENAERLAAELLECARVAREQLIALPLPPDPPLASAAALPEAA